MSGATYWDNERQESRRSHRSRSGHRGYKKSTLEKAMDRCHRDSVYYLRSLGRPSISKRWQLKGFVQSLRRM
jgi:hypothetical protein